VFARIKGRLSLGIYRYDDYTTATNTPEETAILTDFARVVEAGDSPANVVPDIQRVKYTKNFWNVAFSSMTALSRLPLDALWNPPTSAENPPPPSVTQARRIEEYSVPAVRALLMELVALGHAIGWADDADKGVSAKFVDATLANTAALHRRPAENGPLMASMLVDVLDGRPIEVEVIFGSVVRLARKYHVETPVSVRSAVRRGNRSLKLCIAPRHAVRHSSRRAESYVAEIRTAPLRSKVI
jgi:2-dehydropantoate 2-reductase